MTITMSPDVAKILRAPFPAGVVGKLPRIWCAKCRDAQGKVCDNHRRIKCDDCRNNITTAHLHLDYVGHAETTDRLLQADPGWTWEPLAFTTDGLPAFDNFGGLWIRLTIAGVTRLGYGSADGKKGADAVKEVIGDAIRNASMRFGVALDLWGAKFKEDDSEPETAAPPASGTRSESAPQQSEPTEKTKAPSAADIRDWALKSERTGEELRAAHKKLVDEHPATARLLVVNEHGDDELLAVLMQRRIHDAADTAAAAAKPDETAPPPAMVTDEQHRHMHALWREVGFPGDENRDNRLLIINRLLGRAEGNLLTTSKGLTLAEADQVIAGLKARRDAVKRQPEGANA